MKVVDNKTLYSVSDLARELCTPHSTMLTWIYRDKVIPAPTQTLPGGRRLFFSEEVYQAVVAAFRKGKVSGLRETA